MAETNRLVILFGKIEIVIVVQKFNNEMLIIFYTIIRITATYVVCHNNNSYFDTLDIKSKSVVIAGFK